MQKTKQPINAAVGLFLIFFTMAASRMYGCSYLITQSIYFNDFCYVFITAVSLMFLFISAFNLSGRTSSRQGGDYAILNVSLLLIVSVEILYSIYRYEQSLRGTLKEAMYYIAPVLVYLVFDNFARKHDVLSAMKYIFVRASIFVGFISLFEYVLLRRGMDILQLGNSITERYGTPRYNLAAVLFITALFFSISDWFSKETKFDITNLLNIVLIAVNLIFVSKGRSWLMYAGLAIVFGFFVSREFKIHRVFIVLFIILAAVVMILPNILDSLNIYIGEDAGIQVRFEAVEYYVNQIKENPVLGMGFINTSSSQLKLVSGTSGLYYQSDVGIIGFIDKFGFIGFFWLLAWFIKSIFCIVKNKMNNSNWLFAAMFMFFLVITNINLCLMDNNKTLYLPVAMITVVSVMKEKEKQEVGGEQNNEQA